MNLSETTRARLAFFALAFPVASWYSFAGTAQIGLNVPAARWGLLLALSSIFSIASMRGWLGLPARWRSPVAATASAALPLTAAALVLSAAIPLTAILLPVFGLSLGIVQLTANARANELENRLGRSVLASCHGFFSLGVFAAGAVAVVTARVGAQSTWIALSITATAVAGWSLHRVGTPPEVNPTADTTSTKDPPVPVPVIPLLLLVASAVVLRLIDGAINTWHTSLVEHDLGLTGLGGAAYAAFAVGGVGIRFVADATRARFGVLAATAVVGPPAALAFALALHGTGAVPILCAMVLVGAALGISYPELLKIAASRSSSGADRMMALVLTGGTVGSLLANPVMGVLAESFSTRSAFLVLTIASEVAFLFLTVRYVLWRRAPRGSGGHDDRL